MPKLNDGLVDHNLTTGSYGYSAVSLEDLGAAEYTLVTIVQDISGSVCGFKDEMEACLKEVIKSCKFSPRADNLMIRLVGFNTSIHEIHGFKLLDECNENDYDGILHCNGGTSLFDASENAIAASSSYGQNLTQNGYDVNSIVIILTDGCDNGSSLTQLSVNTALKDAMRAENLESIVTILVGVGVGQYPEIGTRLDEFKTKGGLSQFIDIKDADAKSLAKLAAFITQSISAQSQSLGTGSASTPLPSVGFLNF